MIQFSRRFGQPSATYAGICTCRGDACIITDVDLQDPPELMKEMVDRWQKNGSDVVYAQRKTRAGETLIKKIVARSGYALINRMGDVDIPVKAYAIQAGTSADGVTSTIDGVTIADASSLTREELLGVYTVFASQNTTLEDLTSVSGALKDADENGAKDLSGADR